MSRGGQSPPECAPSICGKAVLGGAAQPMDQRRHTTADILAMQSQEEVKFGERFEEACVTKVQIQDVYTEDTAVILESGKPEVEEKHLRNVVFQGCGKEQEDKTKDPTKGVKTLIEKLGRVV